MTESDSALLISIIGFFNTGGRIITGAVTDHPRVDALLVSTIALFFGKYIRLIYFESIHHFSGAICPFLMTLCFDFWSFTIVCILFGLSLSAWIAVTSPLMVILLPPHSYNNLVLT